MMCLHTKDGPQKMGYVYVYKKIYTSPGYIH